MSGMAVSRLRKERGALSQTPHPGFIIKLAANSDGSKNIMIWECYISGKKNTAWEGCMYHLRMTFDEDYPLNPPSCQFDPPLFHPNIFPSGTVCLPLLDSKKDWRPSITILEILQGIQNLLNEPNMKDPPAFAKAHSICRVNRDEYERCIRAQAKRINKLAKRSLKK